MRACSSSSSWFLISDTSTLSPTVRPPGVAFSIDKIYVKDLSLESPGAPQSFLLQEQPQVEVGLRTRGEQIQPDVYECVLTVTLNRPEQLNALSFPMQRELAGVWAAAQGDPGVSGLRCRVVVDGQVRDDRSTDEYQPFIYCLVKSV